MIFTHEIEFDPREPEAAFAQLPAGAAVFALRGEAGEPYLNRTADLRRRVRKLLTPAQGQTRRLQLAGLVRRISWVETSSEWAGQWLLCRAARAAFGEKAGQRLHLRAPFFLRMGVRNRFPRVWVTNALSLTASADLFGPFPSRHAAERYAEAVLDLHVLRRCFQDLEPDPEFPGCIYSEMKKCLAPCFGGCSDERYEAEAAAVHAFLRTGGASLLQAIAEERERASAALDFEAAATLHTRYGKAEAAAGLAPKLARALHAQRGVVVQASVDPDCVELTLLAGGVLTGPALFSMLGMRLPNEGAGSTSLFAHPAVIEAVPLEPGAAEQPRTPDQRLRELLEGLEWDRQPPGKQELCDHQALLARWYFRPQTKREGELVLLEEGAAGMGALLRACARVYRAAVERSAPRMATSGAGVGADDQTPAGEV